MNGKSDGTGHSEKDKGFVNVDVIKTVVNHGSSSRSKSESCFGNRKSLVSRIALLALILLIGIILIIFVCAFNSEIVKQMEIMNLKVSQSMKNVDTAQENLMDKINELKSLELARPSCPDGWFKIRSSCYYFSTITARWQKANDTCAAQKSYLLIITSPEEIGALLPLTIGKGFWIGLKKINSQWTWVDGTPLTFSQWKLAEPNNRDKEENCTEMKTDGWNDLHCSSLDYFICKM
ncbi:CD209 antigen-like protein C [Anomaloglossus baeobatrachus]|uniref:CD209 antigen-like protein C n=1 Tax=Anomaloglossus baeobatrachus TaxID=238106 RepID=UPI003F4FD8AB